MKKHIYKIINNNTRWFSPRVRLGAVVGVSLLVFYGSVFYLVKTLGSNRAYAFGRPSIIEMDAVARAHYADDLKKLLVKDPEQIHMLLGQDLHLVMAQQPDLQRKDAMMSMWQYRSDACVLDVYFKPAEKWEYAPVMHYEMRQRQKAMFLKTNTTNQQKLDDDKTCLISLMIPQKQTAPKDEQLSDL